MPIVQTVLLGLLAALLIAAIGTDLRARLIPNWLTGSVALLAIGWWLAAELAPRDMLFQAILAILAFGVFAIVFAFGAMGGGDVKLIAALALWLPAPLLLKMLVLMAIGGGLLTVAMLILHAARHAEGRPEIPYGVAIAGATLFILANDLLTKPLA